VSAVLSLDQVSKRYRRKGPWVLDGADLAIPPGTTTAVIGGNGSGKSTLLRIAAGVTSPTAGRVVVPRRVGYTPERQAGRCPFTPRQYLVHMARIRGLDAPSSAATTDELLGRFDVRPGPDVPWRTLSKGNRQKVALAQAILGRPELIVLDEPYTGLDDDARDVLDRLIEECTDTGSSVLISRHADSPTSETARCYRLAAGRVVGAGSPGPRPLDGGARWRRIVLSTPGRPKPLEDLARLDGVRNWVADASIPGVVLLVAAARTDDVLRAALGLGWSVQAVGPGQPGQPGQPEEPGAQT
jgi:ABC-type multidrug transport system ATPase subunit